LTIIPPHVIASPDDPELPMQGNGGVVRAGKTPREAGRAALDVPTKKLNEAVRRNAARFPEDFMFQLKPDEAETLRSQFATSNGRGGRRYIPYAFTELGVAMLSSVPSGR
jgi:ORF6N domain